MLTRHQIEGLARRHLLYLLGKIQIKMCTEMKVLIDSTIVFDSIGETLKETWTWTAG